MPVSVEFTDMIRQRWNVTDGFVQRLKQAGDVDKAVNISLTLGRVLREDEASERAWLEAKRSAFDGRSAKEMISAGKIDDVLRLARSEWD